MKVYFYVERDKLESIKRYGLLSARAYYEIFGTVDKRKYGQQFRNALQKYPELRRLVKNKNVEESILTYLDWRDDRTLRGSRAVYFLYYPIPNDTGIRQFIKKYRGDFLHGRVLLEYDLKTRYEKIGELAVGRPRDWWILRWKNQPRRPGALWFEGIPHGYAILNKIDWIHLKAVDSRRF